MAIAIASTFDSTTGNADIIRGMSGHSSLYSGITEVRKSSTISEAFDKLELYRTGQNSRWTCTPIKKSSLKCEFFQIEELDNDKKQTQLQTAKSTLSSHLNKIKNIFSVNDEERAAILGVSRKTVHNWIQGITKPNKSKLQMILSQSLLAEEWLNCGYPVAENIDAIEKHDLLEMLMSYELDKEAVLFYGSSLMLSKSTSEIVNPFA